MMTKHHAYLLAAGAAFTSLAISDVRQSIATPMVRTSDVIVTNSPSQAVPVVVTGTPTVQLSGTVPVSGFPAVQQVAGEVKTITNDGQQPVTAKSTGASTQLNSPSTSGEGAMTFLINNGTTVTSTIPGGKRFVVETLSAKAELPAMQMPGEVEVISGNSIVYLPMQRVGQQPSGYATYAAAVPARMYIDSSATFYWTRSDGTGSAFLTVTASGYLVDVQ